VLAFPFANLCGGPQRLPVATSLIAALLSLVSLEKRAADVASMAP